jgi:hypothetical protein
MMCLCDYVDVKDQGLERVSNWDFVVRKKVCHHCQCLIFLRHAALKLHNDEYNSVTEPGKHHLVLDMCKEICKDNLQVGQRIPVV